MAHDVEHVCVIVIAGESRLLTVHDKVHRGLDSQYAGSDGRQKLLCSAELARGHHGLLTFQQVFRTSRRVMTPLTAGRAPLSFSVRLRAAVAAETPRLVA